MGNQHIRDTNERTREPGPIEQFLHGLKDCKVCRQRPPMIDNPSAASRLYQYAIDNHSTATVAARGLVGRESVTLANLAAFAITGAASINIPAQHGLAIYAADAGIESTTEAVTLHIFAGSKLLYYRRALTAVALESSAPLWIEGPNDVRAFVGNTSGGTLDVSGNLSAGLFELPAVRL